MSLEKAKEYLKKYNLENNLKIDFIGKWYLGEEIGVNYYCDK